eukprot:3391820-Amphidinium_carterae.1
MQRLQASLASLHVAEADLAHDGRNRRHAVEVAELELEQLKSERHQLEIQLASCQAGVVTWRKARARSRAAQ